MKRVAVLWFISAGLVLITLFGTGSAVPLGAVGALEAATGAPVFGGFVWLLCAVSIGIGALTLGVLRAARRSAADISPENETSARRLRLLGQKLQYYCGVLVLAQLILFLWLLFTRTIPILPHDLLPSPVQVAAGREFKELSRSALPDRFLASPAFADGKIFLRGETNLFCLGPQAVPGKGGETNVGH